MNGRRALHGRRKPALTVPNCSSARDRDHPSLALARASAKAPRTGGWLPVAVAGVVYMGCGGTFGAWRSPRFKRLERRIEQLRRR